MTLLNTGSGTFSESYNILFTRRGQVFYKYETSDRGSRRKTGNCIAVPIICTISSEDIKEVDIYNDWSYKIQSYIENQAQCPNGIDNVFPITLNNAKNRLLMDDR